MRAPHYLAAGLCTFALVLGAMWAMENEAPAPESKAVKTKAEDRSWSPGVCDRGMSEWSELNRSSHRVECGYFRVKESVGRPALAFLRVVRVVPVVAATLPPLLVIPGGPGDGITPDLSERMPYMFAFGRERELLFVDPRGAGASRPRLSCETKLRKPADLEKCYEKWHRDLDPGAYRTSTIVEDLSELLAELSVDSVDLLATSYGTKVASRLAEKQPKLVRAVILDSPMPWEEDLLSTVAQNAYAALTRVLQDCEENRACQTQLAVSPAEFLQVVDAMGKNRSEDAPSAERFVEGLSLFMYSPRAVEWIPFLVSEAREGRFSLFHEWMEAFRGHPFAFGLHLSVQCSEVVPFTSEASIDKGDASVPSLVREPLSARAYVDYCRRWRVPTALPRELASPRYSAPTLVLSGGDDPITPQSFGRLQTSRLENARQVVFDKATHGVAFTECGAKVVKEFFRDPGIERVDSPSCATDRGERAFGLRPPASADRALIARELHSRL